MLLCLMIGVTAWADAQKKQTEPDYKTDYYMIVESRGGGIDIYANPDLESAKLNEELIPNGTALHIEGEVEDEPHKRTWGYVTYHGMKGFVPLDDCRPAASRQEAIDSELYIAGRDHVDYNADYHIEANTREGSWQLYQGPGEKYGTVPGVREIKNGENLHITREAEMVDGSRWGVTTVDGKEGWVNLDDWKGSSEEKPSVTPTERETVTEKISEASAEKEKATEKISAVPAEMERARDKISVTPTGGGGEPTEKTPEREDTVSASLEASAEMPGEDAEKASSSRVEASFGIPAPFWWIFGAAVLAVIGLLIYHYKKR